MSMMSITLQTGSGAKTFAFDPTKGRKANSRMIAVIKMQLANLKPAMEHALDLMETNEETLFRTEGASAGVPWRQYTAAEQKHYLPIKRSVLGTDKPMMRWSRSGGTSPSSGERLYPSLIRKNQYSIAVATKHGFEYGTKVPYAANHQKGRGTYKGKYNIPQRKILVMDDKTQKGIVRAIQAHLFVGRQVGQVSGI